MLSDDRRQILPCLVTDDPCGLNGVSLGRVKHWGEAIIRDLARLQEACGFWPNYFSLLDRRAAREDGTALPPLRRSGSTGLARRLLSYKVKLSMPREIDLRAVKVGTGSQDTDARLVFLGDRLVAILVRLDDPAHEGCGRGGWFLEALFGLSPAADPPIFSDLAAAEEWLGEYARGA